MTEGERVRRQADYRTTGPLSKDAAFRLIVSGPVGVREIDRLIRKLELDKEILAEESEEPAADEGARL
jgi:hypothetical protein